jgi:hypothetical protein
MIARQKQAVSFASASASAEGVEHRAENQASVMLTGMLARVAFE